MLKDSAQKKLICCKCSSALSIFKFVREKGKKKSKWSLGCQNCNLTPMISSYDFNKIIEKWTDSRTQIEYEKRFLKQKEEVAI